MPAPVSEPAHLEAQQLLAALMERGQTIATCESLTAGLAAATLASVPGASGALRGGLITYATEVKSHFLGAPVAQLEAQGVVSAATAAQMAAAARRECGSDWGMSFTGVAGPDLQEGKPAGTVFVGLQGPGYSQEYVVPGLGGGREAIRAGAVAYAFEQAVAVIRALK